MELPGKSEKQHLIDGNLENFRWFVFILLFFFLLIDPFCRSSNFDPRFPVLFRMSRSHREASDSDFTDEASSVDGLWESEWVCHESESMSGAERDARRRARRKLLFACAVSLVFMTGEVIGGYAAHSLAIMTDAAHLLADFGSINISLFSLWISSRPRTQAMTFGWHRAEILGMLLSIASIWAVTAALVFSAAQRITDDDYEIDSGIMLITSGCAVGVNILMVLILHQSGTSHGHGHGFPTSQHHSHSHGNASVKAAFIHVVGDLLQSVGVLLAAIVIHFRVRKQMI
uniref:Probable proton-coupled zinc antiporter SLC30A3 n=1 Tax=Salarias fasciatus TaxID=181472 RepID=A0A672HK56_SALFA